MKIKELLNKFNLDLDLSENVLNLDFEGTFSKCSKKEDENGTYYIFEDDLHHIVINENSRRPITYLKFLKKGIGPISERYNSEGARVAFS